MIGKIVCAVALGLLFDSSLLVGSESRSPRPNILWLSAEDISPHLGCYGDPHAITPTLDRLASEGVRFTQAFTTAGVCAPCRSGIITGMYQTTLGTHHMRGDVQLPDLIRPFPAYLRDAGYYCTNNSKQDYQFKTPKGTWDESSPKAHWRNRPDENQPFFAVFNFTGCHESGIASLDKYQTVTETLSENERQDPQSLTTLPPYYPDTAITREDWKRNYELITALDHWADELIAQLKEDGLYDSTIIFFWSDHGVGLPRAKRWLYDSGTHIPLIVRIPADFREADQAAPGSVSDRLVSSIDLGPTVLRLAEIEIPSHVQGQPFMGTALPREREFVFGARDRMDERYDIIRMVRDKRFKYLRNYEPLKSYYQYINTAEKGATMSELRRLFEAGTLNETAARYFQPTKPVEELYDTQVDPHELVNLAADPEYADVLRRMRVAQQTWVCESRDLGLIPEGVLAAEEHASGDRYGLLRSASGLERIARVAEVAQSASAGADRLLQLVAWAKDPDPAVRYWALTGIGNLAAAANLAETSAQEGLADASPTVRVAAARALCRMERPDDALPVLVKVLENGAQWERLAAAIVLDEIDSQALPVIAAMEQALEPRTDLYADGKYTVRVTNRALNQLRGTDHDVP